MQPKVPLPPPARRKLVWLFPTIVVLVMVGGFFIIYRLYFVQPPPTPVVRKTQLVVPATPPAASAVPLPGQEMIDAGQSAILARRAKEQERINALATGQEVPEKSAPNSPPSVQPALPPKGPEPKPTTAMTTTQIAPGISATSSTLLTGGAASPAFRSFVANSKISGVFQGTPVRALINSTLYRAGDLVSPSLGIRFVGINVNAKTMTFRDESGATVSRKY